MMDSSPLMAPTVVRQSRHDPRLLGAMRLVWIVLFCVCALLFIQAVPARYQQLIRQGNQALYQPDSSEVDLLAEYNVSQSIYAAYLLSFEVLQIAIFAGVSSWLFWRKPDDLMAIFTAQTLLITGVAAPATLQALGETGQFGSALTMLAILRYISTMLFIFIFPDGEWRPRWTLWVAGLWTVGIALVPFVGGSPSFWPPLLQTVMLIGWLGPAVVTQIYRYQKLYTAEQQQQAKWFVFGVLCYMVANVLRSALVGLLPFLSEPGPARLLFRTLISVPIFDTLLFAIVPFSILISIFRFRLYGIDLLVNRSLVYGGLTAMLAILFFCGFFLIQGILRGVINQDTTLALVISTAICFALFNPTRVRLQHIVDRRFFHLRVDLNELNQRRIKPFADRSKAGLLSGRTLGDYEMGDMIGKGGMGEVYKAQHLTLDRVVAAKVLANNLAIEADFRSRFEREAKMIAKLNHPNIVSLYDFGVHDDVCYMIMEYLNGQTLSERLQKGALPLAQACWITHDVATALDYAHQQGIIHRDVKPGNVMLCTLTPVHQRTQRAILMDFGIAKMRDSTTTVTHSGLIGTLDYAAPEQIMNAAQVDNRVDIYALGVMLYQMLTGELPFKGSAGQIVFAHLQQPIPDPRELVPDLPANVTAVLLRALAKDPDDRYQTAGELASALCQYS